MQEKFRSIEAELTHRYVDRMDEIHGLTLAALSGKHVFLLGPPGTAKSEMGYDFSEYFDASWFNWQLNENTSPDELFGSVDISALKQGIVRRITTNKLPEAQMAHLDEIFKASSPCRNGMLKILQERKFDNNGGAQSCPLIFAVTASNELPEQEDKSQAFYDRMLLRYNVSYLSDVAQFRELLQLERKPKVVEHISMEGLAQAQAEVKALVFSGDAEEALALVWERVRDEGMYFSDRRYRQLMEVMAAESWHMGEAEVVPESVMVAIHVLWDTPQQIRTVNQIVRTSVNPHLAKAEEIYAAAKEALEQLEEASPAEEQLQVIKQFRQMEQELLDLRVSSKITSIRDQITMMRETLVTKLTNGGI